MGLYYVVYNVLRCSSVSACRMTVKNDIVMLFICIAYNCEFINVVNISRDNVSYFSLACTRD